MTTTPSKCSLDHDKEADKLIKQGFVAALCDECGEALCLTVRIMKKIGWRQHLNED